MCHHGCWMGNFCMKITWLGYEKDFASKHIDCASTLDRQRLCDQEGRYIDKKRVQPPLMVTFHPALKELREIAKKLHAMFDKFQEHRRTFKEQPLGLLDNNQI